MALEWFAISDTSVRENMLLMKIGGRLLTFEPVPVWVNIQAAIRLQVNLMRGVAGLQDLCQLLYHKDSAL